MFHTTLPQENKDGIEYTLINHIPEIAYGGWGGEIDKDYTPSDLHLLKMLSDNNHNSYVLGYYYPERKEWLDKDSFHIEKSEIIGWVNCKEI